MPWEDLSPCVQQETEVCSQNPHLGPRLTSLLLYRCLGSQGMRLGDLSGCLAQPI
jgi:hypothetical protein